MGRHTFATTVTLSQGVPIETVSRMLGHTNIHTTQIYAKITNDKISRDMAELTDKLGDKYRIDRDRPQSDFRNIKLRIRSNMKSTTILKPSYLNVSVLRNLKSG